MMKYFNKKATMFIALFLAMILPDSGLKAQPQVSSQRASVNGLRASVNAGWYLGVEGGPAFGVSTLSSFGADKTRAGYVVGTFVGYQFNPVFSLEVNARWNHLKMSARPCCIDSNDWLSADGIRYAAEVLGEKGAYYGNLKNDVYGQNYGLRLNVNVLGFVPSLKDSPWKVEVSPQVSLEGSWAKNKRLDSDETFRVSSEDKWKLGYGGNLQASYGFPCGLTLGVFSGMTFVNGGRIDALPKTFHKNNFVWESGARISFNIHK